MKKAGLWKTLGYGVVGLGVLAAGLAVYVFGFRLGYIEQEPRRTLLAAGIDQPVEVYRDTFGIPHIDALSTNDALFAVGYSMAEDRLTQLEMIRRTSRGELAAIMGPDLVEYDEWYRGQAYTRDELLQMLSTMGSQERAAFQAMVDGINRYVAEAIENPDQKLPIEFDFYGIEPRAYEPEEILSAIAMIIRKFGTGGGTELTNQSFLQAMIDRHGEDNARRIFDDILPLTDPDSYAIASDQQALGLETLASAQMPSILSDGALNASAELRRQSMRATDMLAQFGLPRSASRTIVVGQERSATGNPLMLQGTADGPEIHLKTPEFEFAGLTVPPVGLPLQGRNLNVGMVITTGERDTIDTFVVETDPDNPNRYLYGGQWLEMDVRVETITVKDGADVTIELAKTIHGPVILRDEDNNLAYSQRWAIWMQEANVWADILRLLKSDSADSYAAKLRDGIASNANLSYAGDDGVIGFRHTGSLPIRAAGTDPRLPAKGDGSEDWAGMHPHHENPAMHAPAQDFLHAWNNNPAQGTIYGDGARWGKHFRTHLPLELIQSKDTISVDDLKEFNRTLSASFYSIDLSLTTPRHFAPYLREAAALNGDPKLIQAAELMIAWDGLFTDSDKDGYYDHPGAILFRTWLPHAMEAVFNDDIGDWWQQLDDELYIPYQTSLLIRVLEGEDAGLPMQFDYFGAESRPEIIARSLAATTAELSARFGDDNPAHWLEPIYWRYMSYDDASAGDKHTFLPRRATGYSGGGVMLRYLPKVFTDNGAPEWLAIMEITPDKPYYLSAIPSGGQSWFINTGWKASPHINDQYALHEALQFKTVQLDWDTIVAEHGSHLTIQPTE
ncbi:MAG: penicillin acylase family protein [Pseudomonadota bacterium]